MVDTRAFPFVVAISGLVGLVVTGCAPAITNPAAGDKSRETTASTPAPMTLQDPLIALDDPNSPDYLIEHPEPILHDEGIGSKAFAVALPDDVSSVSFYVACEPSGQFRVDAADNFFEGGCTPRFQAFAQIPVDANAKSLEVMLTLPEDVRRFLVALPNE